MGRGRIGRLLFPKSDGGAVVGHIDATAGGRVNGWALAPGGTKVEAWIDGKRIASITPSLARPDVATAYPGRSDAATCGFSLSLPDIAMRADGQARVVIRARSALNPRPGKIIGEFDMIGDHWTARIAAAPDSGILGPFPKPVIDAVAAVWPDDCADLASVPGQRRFADRLCAVMAIPNLNALPVFADYARYLALTRAHCEFVSRHFPATNTRSAPGAPDYHCKPNSVREVFTIVHQLYVLKSWGVDGDFAEFGCFKGFSSSMLSFACGLLGVRMHIFDSFEGLPPSEGSGYAPGEYAGGIDEVRDHIARFGTLDPVTFHKGFFSDTFRDYRPPQLMALWMDVDLESSARDLMVVADRLDPRATLFSHECTSEIFRNGDIVTAPRGDNPVPPMLARHAELDRPLTGRYVSGFTGSFWPRQGGIPVVDNDVLMQLSDRL
jgi:O-methyltransferase